MQGRIEVHVGFWWGNLEERNHLEDLSVDGSIILKWTLNKEGVRVWAGFNWLTIGANCGLSLTW